MKKSFLLVLSFLFMASFLSAQFWTEDFSTGTQYTVTLGAEGEDGSSDYFIRTDDNTGFNIGPSYTGINGFFFAGQDIDDTGWVGSANPSELTWSNVDISGQTNLEFRGKFASVATAGIDNSDYLHVQYNIDSGGWTDLLWFENDGTQYNTYFIEDTDFSGDGEGTQLTSTFVEFTKTIPSTGSLLSLRITCAANSGGEDFAFDNFELSAAGGNSLPVISNIAQTPSSNIGTSTTVSISADATDSDGTISSVELHWGLSSGSLGNTISMSNGGSGVTYTTATDILAQSEGSTVYYEVEATDDEPESSTSLEYNYYVSDAVGPSLGDLIITEICGDGVGGIADDGFMEIYNTTSNTLSLTNIQARYFNNGSATPTQTVNLSGTIASVGYIVITQNETNFNTTYAPIIADFSGSLFYFNGGDDGVDIYDTVADAVILDSFNDNGTGASPWTWSDSNVFERTSTGDGGTITNWTEITTGIGTPGEVNDNPLPVYLTDFSTAIIMNEFVQVNWTTQTESSINNWKLYRSTENNSEQVLLDTQFGTNTTEPTTYTFEDYEVEEDITYNYYLEANEYDGASMMWGPISAILGNSTTPPITAVSMLQSNYPNPFNPSTTINCAIKDGEVGTLTIYNARGQVVEKQTLNAGEHRLNWNGTAYGSGVYLYKLETESYTKTRKMIMIK